ncbi:MAG: SIMPL domain-containing protein [Pseudomonadota bacterium]
MRLPQMIAALIALPLALNGLAEAEELPATLSMTGTGSVSVAPDQATVTLGVETVGPTAAEALAANNEPAARLIAMLKAAGVAPADIGTVNLGVFPRFARNDRGQEGPPKIIGYQVSNTLQARIRDLDALGPILDQAVEAGATTISQVSFGNADLSQPLDAARELAVADATRKAAVVAEAAGVTLGPILSISEGVRSGPQPYLRGRALAAEASAVPIEAGARAQSVQISIVWDISPER